MSRGNNAGTGLPIPTREHDLSAIETGANAQRVQPLIASICSERQQHIVQQLITDYKSRALTSDRLWAAVGALAELHDIETANMRKIEAMHRAQQREMK